jgi:hypothetical protein
MQTVGAQWLMGDLGSGALAMALAQAATTLPVFLLVVPAGALGDILDRRRLLLAGQALMCARAAGITAATTTAGRTTPPLLLGLIAIMGVGQALSVPSFQAIQLELVGRREVPQAAVLNGANINIARGRSRGGRPADRRRRPGCHLRLQHGVVCRRAGGAVPVEAAAGPPPTEHVVAATRAGALHPERPAIRHRTRAVGAVHDLRQRPVGAIAGRGPRAAAARRRRVRRAVTVRTLRLPRTSLDLSRTLFWPEPAAGPDSDAGPVLVEVQWRVPEPNAEAFVDAMHHVSRSRKRTGATLWGLFRDVSEPSLYVETFHGGDLARASAPAPAARHGVGSGTGGGGPGADHGRHRAGGPALAMRASMLKVPASRSPGVAGGPR